MSARAIADFIEAVRQHHLLNPGQLTELVTLQRQHRTVESLAGELVQRNWLTPFQVTNLGRGKGQDLVLGSYVVLERIGQGGMGEVFLARHQLMNRLVALKLIRSELLSSAQSLRRFRREIQAVAQLSHPNIIAAYDAEQIGDRVFLVMEYGNGPNLAQLVRRMGPLSIGLACRYGCEAALGLQQAFERGVLHRDIKPENLLITDQGLKILDLGLARSLSPESPGGTVTTEAVIMGTPDYLAPEQANDANSADIRADLYALGGTLYFALSGQVPFPGGTMLEKILRHRLEEPVALERLRPEIPPAVAAIVRKLMAKQPADRFQTPAELESALRPHVDASVTPDLVQREVDEDSQVSAPGSSTGFAPSLPAADKTPLQADSTWPRSASVSVPTRGFKRIPVKAWIALTAVLLLAASAATLAILLSKPTQGRRADDAGPRLESSTIVIDTLPEEVNAVAFAPTGSMLAIGCGSLREAERPGAVHLWDSRSGHKLGALGGHTAGVMSIAFSDDGRVLAAGTGSADAPAIGEVRLWEPTNQRLLGILDVNKSGLVAVAFQPKTMILATAGRDRMIDLWDIGKLLGASGKESKTWDRTSPAHVTSLAGHTDDVLALAFSPNGALLASGGSDKTLRLWNVADRKPLATLSSRNGGIVYRLAFSPDGQVVAAGTGVYRVAEAKPEIMLLHVAQQRLEAKLVDSGPDIEGIVFAPDSQTLLTGNRDGVLQLWSVPELALIESRKCHQGWIWSMSFSSDYRLLATGSWDRTVKLWRWGTGEQ